MVQDDWLTTPAPGEDKIPPTPVIYRRTKEEAGIIIDGDYWKTRGMAMLLIKEGEYAGWVADPSDQHLIDLVRQRIPISGQQLVEWTEMLISIEEWLNENAVPDGYRFGWMGNQFMLLSEENWCKRTGKAATCDDAGHNHG